MKKILMISKQYPYPPRCGFSVRLADMCNYLCKYFEIHILVDSHGSIQAGNDISIFSEIYSYPSSKNQSKIFSRIKQRFSRPYFDDAYYIADDFIDKVKELQQKHKYDICMIHTPIFARCLYALPDNVYKVVDTHDIWYQKYNEFEKIGEGKLLSHYRDKNHELDFYRKMDLVIAISLWDFHYLTENGIHQSVYTSVSFSPKSLKRNQKCKNKILYPAGRGPNNRDAIEFFIKEILPLVKKEIDDVEFMILNPDKRLMEQYSSNPAITFIPFIENIIDAYAQADIVVIPLRVKSGLKIKLLESFSYGIPTILSFAATQGIHIDSYAQKKYSVSPESFSSEIIDALSSYQYRQELSESGLKIIQKYYSPDKVYSDLIDKLRGND